MCESPLEESGKLKEAVAMLKDPPASGISRSQLGSSPPAVVNINRDQV